MISVITITRNNPSGFARTRESVQAQVYPDFEWIVVDGNAEPDSGIYDAMNKGIDRARGTHMIFMNAGDVFAAPDTLERIAPHLDADFIYGDALEGGHSKPARHDIRQGMITHHQAMIYRRGPLRYDLHYRIAADYKFTAQHLLKGSRRYLPFPICMFDPGGISQRRSALGRREQAQIRRELGIQAPLAPLRQACAQALKTGMPRLYWALRSAS